MKCPVCGNDTLNDYDHEFQICKQCFWEYDEIQVNNPDYEGGANNHSLNEYKKIYERLLKENPNFSCKNKEDAELIVAMDNEETD